MCVFCNLAQESHEHLFHECCKTQGVWDLISTATGKNIFFPAGFVSGNWISLTSYSMRAKVLIAFAACFFGKPVVMQFSEISGLTFLSL